MRREWPLDKALVQLGKSLGEKPRTLADAFSELQLAQMVADGCLEEELVKVFPNFTKVTFDYYDMSFEVFGAGEVVPSPAQLGRFGELGFRQFWTHEHGYEKRKPGERFYFLGQLPRSSASQRGT